MALQGTLKVTGFNTWMDMEGAEPIQGIEEKCTKELLESYIHEHVRMRDVEVRSAKIDRSGRFTAPNLMGAFGNFMPPMELTDLPPFASVEIAHKTGKYTETVWVWVPLTWNGRLFGCCGGGNRTAMFMDAPGSRGVALSIPLRNGFAAVCSDGANREDEFFGWGVDWEKREMGQELYNNWLRYSTHTMTVLAKAVIEALTGEQPAYSYIWGLSGGGRQVLSEAQNYPHDYDGYWSDAPCVSYNRMLLALSWPYVVMNSLGNTLPPAKLNAFKEAAWEKAGGREAFFNTTEFIDMDPFELVGAETEAGTITELDARTMQLIWQGSQTEDGEFLWYGMRPGVDAWTNPSGYSAVTEIEGSWMPVDFMLNEEYIKNWIMKDPSYDTSKIDIKEFTSLFRQCQELFSDMDTDSADLRELRDLGGKMILCHGVDDDAIYVDGSIAYYDKIINLFGGLEGAKEVCRLLIVPGDGHGIYTKNGAGPSVATGMEALMKWVEEGDAPDAIHGQRLDPVTFEVLEEKDTPIR